MQNKIFWEGTWGAEFYGSFAPREGDTIISRYRTFDSFIRTDMREKLHAAKIEKVVLAGLTSHTCVESAGRHAHEEGLHVTFLKTQSLSSLRRRTTRRSSFPIPPSVTKC
jgi:nicotinamidase-related amidase